MREKLQSWWKRFSLKQKMRVGTSCVTILVVVIVFAIQMGSTSANQKPIEAPVKKQVKTEEARKPSEKKPVQKVGKKEDEKDLKKPAKEEGKTDRETKAEQKSDKKEKAEPAKKEASVGKQENSDKESKKVEAQVTDSPSTSQADAPSQAQPPTQDSVGTSGNPSKDENNGKTWHEAVTETKITPAVTEQRYVVDVPERMEEVYVGEIVQASTGQQFNSLDEYYNWLDTLPDEDYVSISYSVVPKYETRRTPEQGHYETVVVTPEKKETVVIREAGWY